MAHGFLLTLLFPLLGSVLLFALLFSIIHLLFHGTSIAQIQQDTKSLILSAGTGFQGKRLKQILFLIQHRNNTLQGLCRFSCL